MRSKDKDVKGVGRKIKGVISSSGGIVRGNGFKITRTAVGDYTIVFTPPFNAPPVMNFQNYNATPIIETVFQSEPTSSQVRVYNIDNTGTLTDSPFHFTAEEVSV